jgi:hypothetical protein
LKGRRLSSLSKFLWFCGEAICLPFFWKMCLEAVVVK